MRSNQQTEWSVALVHGIPQVIPTLDRLVKEACPGVKVFSLLHEGIFLELVKEGKMTPDLIKRLCGIISEAENSGASLILVTGSALSAAVDVARKMSSIPILKIDEAMARAAVKKGNKIGLVATEEATLEPSTQRLYEMAETAGKKIEVKSEVSPEARVLVRKGMVEEHDDLVLEKIMALDGEVDVIVLAQASMYSALSKAKKVAKTPIYASPELAAEYVREALQELGWE